MPALFFDTVTMRSTGLVAGGEERSYQDLGVGATLQLFARQLTVEGAPDRSFNIAADRLVITNPAAFQFGNSAARRVRIAAQQIHGPLNIICRGSSGAAGAPGRDGAKMRTRLVVADPLNPRIKEPVLVAPPGPGGPGQPGGNGGGGGFIQLWYCQTMIGPTVAAPGGAGGAGGSGGKGGKGDAELGAPDAPNGPRGAHGAPGPAGTARLQQFSTAADMWARWAQEMGPAGAASGWAAYRLRVAEHLYRTGRPEELRAAKDELLLLVSRVGVEPVVARVRKLLQQLFEHVTYSGMPRDLDIVPDVDFVGRDNDELYEVALELLGHAQTIVSAAEVQGTFADFVRTSAEQGRNSLEAAEKQTEKSQETLKTAVAGTDVARARVKELDKKVGELRTVIKNEHAANSGPFATMMKIVEVGVAVGRTAVAVGTGVGAVVEVAQGFSSIQAVANGASGLFDLVGDVKKHLKDPSMKAFKTSFDDFDNAGKRIIHLGKVIGELDAITSNHPDPRLREIAAMQRERIILEQEVAVHTQMEKEAQLGIDAAKAEETAIGRNIVLSENLAAQIDRRAMPAAEQVLAPVLVAIRQLLDELSVRVFLTLRAREIYLAHDPDEIVRHDLGHIHPDRDQMLTLAQRVEAIRRSVAGRALQIIQWSSLVGEMAGRGDLSQTPVPFFFTTDDPELLDPLHARGELGFYVPVADLFEEDGSQLYEVKFDGVTVILHGARIPNGSGESIRLRQLGRWSVRRRPDASDPAGTIKDFFFPGHHVFLQCRPVEGGVEARMTPPANASGQPPFSLWGRGVAGDWELKDDGGIDLSAVTKVEVGFETQALSRAGVALRAARPRRQLRPLPGGLVPPPAPRLPIPVPPRGGSAYGYRYGVGSVAAVGAVLV